MDDIKGYVDKFATFGRPVEYKGLKMEPIVVGDSELFYNVIGVLQIEKNKVPDVNIIQMSYLEFLLNLIVMDEEVLNGMLVLFNMVFGDMYREELLLEDKEFAPHDLYVSTLPNGEQTYSVNGWDIEMKLRDKGAKLIIHGVEISPNEFDEIRKIIMYQNIFDYRDEEMSEDFRKVVEQYYALRNRGMHKPTLEEKVMAVIVNTAYTMEQIEKMPLRTFDALFQASVSKVDYISSKALEPHLKEGHHIDHWIYYEEKGKYDGIFKDAESLAKKITSL